MKKAVIIISIILGTIIFIGYPINLYLSTFKNPELSKNSSDWGNFSSYLSLIISTIIGLANLILLIFITKLVSKYDDKRMETQKKYDDKRFLNQIAQDAYSLLLAQKKNLIWKNFNSNESRIQADFYRNFSFDYDYLFEDNKESFKNISDGIASSLDSIEALLKISGLGSLNGNGDVSYDMNGFDYQLAIHAQTKFSLYDLDMLNRISIEYHSFFYLNTKLLNCFRNFILNKEIDFSKIDVESIVEDWNQYIQNMLENNAHIPKA